MIFDPTITLGNVISWIALVFTAGALIWSARGIVAGFDKRISALEDYAERYIPKLDGLIVEQIAREAVQQARAAWRREQEGGDS